VRRTCSSCRSPKSLLDMKNGAPPPSSIDSVRQPSRTEQGRVTDFDEHRGLGTVTSDSGDAYMFHCIELADGSRTIAVGADVEFDIREKFSRPEAFAVRIRT
jgi:cold shock CspA family protein